MLYANGLKEHQGADQSYCGVLRYYKVHPTNLHAYRQPHYGVPNIRVAQIPGDSRILEGVDHQAIPVVDEGQRQHLKHYSESLAGHMQRKVERKELVDHQI